MNKYYAYIQDGKINGIGTVLQLTAGVQSIEISKEIYETIVKFGGDYYTFKKGEIIKNPEYEALQAETEKQNRIDEIKQELEEIDKQSQRSARAISLCILHQETPNPEDIEKLTEFENQAGTLREELQELKREGGKDKND